MKEKKNICVICLLIGICFLSTSGGYLSWLYQLVEVAPKCNAELLSEVYAYLFQAVGLLIYALLWKKQILTRKLSFTNCIFLIDFVLMIPAILCTNFLAVLVFGYLMNLFHGIVAGIYLTYMVQYVLQQSRGITFGLGYAVGTIGTWLLSLLSPDNWLTTNYSLIAYGILTFATIVLCWKLIPSLKTLDELNQQCNEKNFSPALITLCCILILFLCTVKGLGFYYPMADITNGSVSLEFSRLFYAFGLIVAGLINDYRRKWGLIACSTVLVFPFLLMYLQNNVNFSLILWLISYMFTGFYSIYRVLLLSDLAKNEKYMWLAGFGLLFGRLGDASGSAIGILLVPDHKNWLIMSSFAMFLVTILIICIMLERLYWWNHTLFTAPNPENANNELIAESKRNPNSFESPEIMINKETYINSVEENEEDKEDISKKEASITSIDEMYNAFAKKYDFSRRETEVLIHALSDKTNNSIAADLFVSDNTIKFHIRNILKKTNCANRNELRELWGRFLCDEDCPAETQ